MTANQGLTMRELNAALVVLFLCGCSVGKGSQDRLTARHYWATVITGQQPLLCSS